MSMWTDVNDAMPPLDEDVLILYKDKTDELTEDNLFYGIAKRCIKNPFSLKGGGYESWSTFTEYQGYYEVVFWCPLVDMPINLIKRLKEKKNENS